jgi:hypothetical protein
MCLYPRGIGWSLSIFSILSISLVPAEAAPPCDSNPPGFTPAEAGDVWYEPQVTNQDISRYWSHFHMSKSNWDGGMGYEDPGNVNLPLAKTFNGQKALENSTPPGATPANSWLAFGYNWARSQIDELDGVCNTNYVAFTRWGWFVDNYTNVAQPFFFNEFVAERAGTLMHEARHAEGWGAASHSGCCPFGTGGCDNDWAYGGGWNIEVSWLADFFFNGINTLQAQKDRARDMANTYLALAFCTDPGFRI